MYIVKKLKDLVQQYRLTNQLKFIDHCKNMPLAYKVSDFSCFSLYRSQKHLVEYAVEAQSMEKPNNSKQYWWF